MGGIYISIFVFMAVLVFEYIFTRNWIKIKEG